MARRHRKVRQRVWRWADEYGELHLEYTRAEARRLSKEHGTPRTAYHEEYVRRRTLTSYTYQPVKATLPDYAADVFVENRDALPRWRSFLRNQRSYLGPVYDWAMAHEEPDVAARAYTLIQEVDAIATTDSRTAKARFARDTAEAVRVWSMDGTWAQAIGISGDIYEWLYWSREAEGDTGLGANDL